MSAARLEGAPNFRDLGGTPTADGRRVRFGHVFRSEVLVGLTDADLEIVRGLGIVAVCDLRHGEERLKKINRWPAGVAVTVIGVPPGDGMEAVQSGGAQSRIADPDFDCEEARLLVIGGYRVMPRALAGALRAVFDHLLAPNAAPLLIHCTSGKDRSGFVCAMLLAALGVSREAIQSEYLLSRERYPVEKIRAMLVRFFGEALPPGRLEALIEVATVSPRYLDAAFETVRDEYGGVGRYLAEAAGLDAAGREALKDRLIDGQRSIYT